MTGDAKPSVKKSSESEFSLSVIPINRRKKEGNASLVSSSAMTELVVYSTME